jgi:hypothetical protein
VKRAWLPNVQRKALWSDALNQSISLRVTTSALRQIDRMGASTTRRSAASVSHFFSLTQHPRAPLFPLAGGLDEYVLGSTPTKLASEKGESLRLQMAAALGVAPAVKSPAIARAQLARLAVEAKRAPARADAASKQLR